MPTDEEDITLTSILTQTRQIETDYGIYEEDSKRQLKELESVISDLEELIKETDDPKDKNTLIQYKSALFQIRNGINTEMVDMKKELKTVKQIAGVTEKAIKWNLGDIF